MITLGTTSDYVLVFFLGAVSGLLGGLAAELLLNRNGETGAFELPARKGALFDLGGFASLIVGAVVGVAILVVFPPETTVTRGADGSSVTVRAYEFVRLAATSLVAGSAGGSVLTALQAGVTAAVNETRVQFAITAGQDQIEKVAELAKIQATAALSAVVPAAASTVRLRGGVMSAQPPPGAATPARTTDAAAAELASAIDAHAAKAKASLAAAVERRP